MAAQQQRTRRGGSAGNRPWRVCLIRTYTDSSGAEKSHFIPIGAAFKNERGFSSDSAGLHVDVRRGDRIALFPPDESDGD